MELIYRAWDGTEFRERSACEKYEYNTPCIPMWNQNGKTKNVEEALIVYLRDAKETKRFVELCKINKSLCDGIDYHEYDENATGTGLFIWDYNTEQYYQMEDEIEQALRHCFNEYHNF